MGLANDYLKQADELRRGHVIQAAFPKKAPSIEMSADPPKADILRCGWAVLAFEITSEKPSYQGLSLGVALELSSPAPSCR